MTIATPQCADWTSVHETTTEVLTKIFTSFTNAFMWLYFAPNLKKVTRYLEEK